MAILILSMDDIEKIADVKHRNVAAVYLKYLGNGSGTRLFYLQTPADLEGPSEELFYDESGIFHLAVAKERYSVMWDRIEAKRSEGLYVILWKSFMGAEVTYLVPAYLVNKELFNLLEEHVRAQRGE